MAKRKAVMKNIIYELDNEDIEISSDEEVSGPKINRLDQETVTEAPEIPGDSEHNGAEILCVDSTDDSVCLLDSPNRTVNGGKTSVDIVVDIDSPGLTRIDDRFQEETEIVCASKNNFECDNTTVFDEDIIVDSPTSLCIAGCENRVPLVSVKFKNSRLLSMYRDRIKKFMIELIKEHQDNLEEPDNEENYELDIWPEDLMDESIEEKHDDFNLFFVDTDPCDSINLNTDIPKYSQVSSTISNQRENVASPPPFFKRGPTCFNCDGAHQLKDCTRPRDNARIAQKRQNKNNTKTGRYHVEDEQKYGHLIPGRISGPLRHALGLKRDELPLYIYRMRMLGYPPGWLEEARISHSGIILFDSTGNATIDPEDEEGEICEAGSKDKYDIKKILDFPGFNVPASSRYKEEAYLYGLPAMSEQDSKIAMLQMLAPNAMKAYKRKKLTLFPATGNNSLQEGHAEMELDSGDEEAEFPSRPPLPDEAPLPTPPPPNVPPPPPEVPPPPPEIPPPPPELTPPPDQPSSPPEQTPSSPKQPSIDSQEPTSPQTIIEDIDKSTTNDKKSDQHETSSDIEIVEDHPAPISQIPLPDDSFIIVDDDKDTEKPKSGRSSPTLDELEKAKQAIMAALQNPNDTVSIHEPDDLEVTEIETDDKQKDDSNAQDNKDEQCDDNKSTVDDSPPAVTAENIESKNETEIIPETVKPETEMEIIPETAKTLESKAGKVKTTSFGTPILNIASSYVKLPNDENFAKDICDVINFENLPNSTGKYKKISNLLKKVKSEVDRIQES